MTARRAIGRISPRRQGRLLGVLLLIVLTGLVAVGDLPGLNRVRFVWFDLCQQLAPRARVSDRVVVVAVDARSLATHGQWPWPRTLLARLLGLIVAGNATAIGIDILMSEPDRLSPPRLPTLITGIDPDLAARLTALPSNDTRLAAALVGRPIVLGIAGVDPASEPASRKPGRMAPVHVVGGDPTPFLRRFDVMLGSLEEVDGAAAGRGLLNVDPEGGAVRRIRLVAGVGGVLSPVFALEMIRVASGASGFSLLVGRVGVRSVAVGTLVIPTQPDATVWLRYAGHTPARFVAAADVLAGTAPRDRFDGKLVVVGVTALAVADRQPIPNGHMDGVEIHAELIESILDGTLLRRPPWARWAESAFLCAGGLLVILIVPRMRTRALVLVLLPLVGLALGSALALYHWRFLLLDAGAPSVGLAVLGTTMLSVTLAEAERQRRALRRQVERQREEAARVEGELSAARRIQMGILPKPADVLGGETRFDLSIVLEPAREVGGDLYDFFMLDGDRLFFLLGDVSGKGLPGSLFMVVSKSLYKSTALRRGDSVATMMREANGEISRDNPEHLFVTVFAGVLDATTGALEYCNAGHDPPYVIGGRGGLLGQLEAGGGPPLCVLEGFAYEAARTRLRRGDTLVVVTDGVTEARSAAGELFGRPRLEALLTKTPAGATPATIAAAIRDEVARFAAGSEPADDLAILVLRWNGPAVERRQTFRARLAEGPRLADFVQTVMAGIDARLAMRVRLVVEELFVNTVTHGHGGDTDAPIDITIVVDGDRVRLTYVDTAPAFDPFAAVQPPDPTAPVEAPSVGHLGVFLVTKFADRYEYARAGEANRISVEFLSRPAGERLGRA